ncbi:hypothetical protein HGRIS_004791 [Hohenbuehelia grisea]|uniref:MARVEL domain-containing protein n=1 Tax=Hohenbuehelia grisea TaxID=104357 RepID=A0ABR3JEL9_9AGAR
MAGFLPLMRLVSFGVIILFSIITLGLSAHITSLSSQVGFYFTFAAMNIATVILTLAFLITFLVVDHLRKGAFTSMIVTELSALGLLWILWLTTAALAAEENAFRFATGCTARSGTVCGEFGAIVAFSFLNWIIVFAYIGVLLVFSIIQATRGNPIWFQSVNTADFNAPSQNQGIAPQMGVVHPQATGASSYPPQSPPQQYQQQLAQPQPQFAGQPGYGSAPGTPQPGPYPQV